MTVTHSMTNAEMMKRREAAIPRGLLNAHPIFADRAEGSHLWDIEGNEYIDFGGGFGALNVGHNHPRVMEAITEQAGRLLHTCIHSAMYEPYLRLAERLNELVPIPGPCKTMFWCSGAEAGENAVKISRSYTKRTGVVGFERAFHGRTLLGMTLTGKTYPYSKGFGPFAPEVYRLPVHPFFTPEKELDTATAEKLSKEAIYRLFNYHVEASNIACIMMEPVLGEGGYYPAHPAAICTLRSACAEHGIVFISDEVQAGFGRCGSMFACERYGLEPDMIAMAKSVGGGTVLSAVTAKAEIMDAPHPGGLGGTYGGSPMSVAAGNAVLDIMIEEKLPERALHVGKVTLAAYHRFAEKFAFVRNPRGLGAMCAFDVINPKTGAGDSKLTDAIVDAARERGVLILTASGSVIRLLMPLNISNEDMEEGFRRMEAAMESVNAG